MEQYVNDLFNKYFNTTKGYFYIVDLIKQEFPYLNLDLNNLKTLKIVSMTDKEFQQTMSHGIYFARSNTIKMYRGKEITPESLIETIIHELIHAITSKIINDIIIEGYKNKKWPISVCIYK